MEFFAQPFLWVAGGDLRLRGWRLHQSAPARRELVRAKGSMGSAPHFAPDSIQALSVARSLAGSGFFGGILDRSTRSHIGLSWGLPGTMMMPSSPPVMARSRRERSSL